jgi:hypothetical protein
MYKGMHEGWSESSDVNVFRESHEDMCACITRGHVCMYHTRTCVHVVHYLCQHVLVFVYIYTRL